MRRAFTNLTLDGRRVIARMLQAKMPKTKTEAILGRDRSPLTREVEKNWCIQDEACRISLQLEVCLNPADVVIIVLFSVIFLH